MKTQIDVIVGRPNQGCRKTVTLNGGPFQNYTIGLVDLGCIYSLLRSIKEQCDRLPTPPVGKPHQLSYELNTTQAADAETEEPSFEFPTYEEMAAYMDAEMARLGIAQPEGATA